MPVILRTTFRWTVRWRTALVIALFTTGLCGCERLLFPRVDVSKKIRVGNGIAVGDVYSLRNDVYIYRSHGMLNLNVPEAIGPEALAWAGIIYGDARRAPANFNLVEMSEEHRRLRKPPKTFEGYRTCRSETLSDSVEWVNKGTLLRITRIVQKQAGPGTHLLYFAERLPQNDADPEVQISPLTNYRFRGYVTDGDGYGINLFVLKKVGEKSD